MRRRRFLLEQDPGLRPGTSLKTKGNDQVKIRQNRLSHALSLAGFCAVLGAGSPALAQQQSAQNSSVFTLGSVSVSGIKENDAQKTETRIDRDQIQLLELNDVGQALQLVPGVQYMGPGGSGGNPNRYESQIKMRGYSLREVPIFMDGVPVYIPYDGYSDLGRFTTDDVSSIQVAKGYSSVMYGHNTMGGVINIVSMRPRSELDVDARAGFGSGGLRQLSANVGTLQDKWYLQAGVSYRERDYTRLSENFVGKEYTGRDVDSDRYDYHTEDRRGSVKIGFIPNATDEYVLSYSRQEAKKYPTDGSGFKPTQWEWPKWDRETVSFISNTRFLNDKFYIKPRIYQDKFKNTMDWWRGQAKGSHYDDSAFGASVELGTEIIDRHEIKLLLSYKKEEHKSFDTDIYTHALIAGSHQAVEQKFYSIALEDTFSINEHWQTQLGAIYTRRKANADGVGANTRDFLAKYPQNGNALNPDIDTIDPQFAVFYKPTKDHTFRASISKKTRFPSFKDAYSSYGDEYVKLPGGGQVPHVILQNPGLKPERAMHYELGYQGRPLDGLQVEASVYYSRSKDAFNRQGPDTTTYPGYAVTQYVNVPGITERKGFDLGLYYQASSKFGLGLAYAYLHMRSKEDSSLHFTDVPRHIGMLYADIRPVPWLGIIPSVAFRSNSYADNKGQNTNSGYGITNLKFEIKPPAWKNVAFSLGIDNLFNKNYQSYSDQYPSPGRMYFANVRINYF